MRPSFWLCLIALGVAIGVVRVSNSVARSDPTPPAPAVAPAPPQPQAAVPAPVKKGRRQRQAPLPAPEAVYGGALVNSNPTWTVDGYGETGPDSEQDALRRARTSVQKYLDEHYGSLGWAPTLEQLQQASVVRLEGAPEARQLEDGDTVQVAHARVELTRTYREQLQKMVRQQHSRQRQWLAARGLAGVVALLLVFGGYLRLEEATRGYYSRLLRLAALGVLVGVGVGLWLL